MLEGARQIPAQGLFLLPTGFRASPIFRQTDRLVWEDTEAPSCPSPESWAGFHAWGSQRVPGPGMQSQHGRGRLDYSFQGLSAGLWWRPEAAVLTWGTGLPALRGWAEDRHVRKNCRDCGGPVFKPEAWFPTPVGDPEVTLVLLPSGQLQ